MRTVSVVVNTLNRASSLGALLDSLRAVDWPCFEVVVVPGPCTDETLALLERRRDDLRTVTTEAANLSVSRNVGIAAAKGEIIAFIDDDALADPKWLRRLVPLFDADDVGAAGGPVIGHTGHELQARYNFSDRFGQAWVEAVPRRLDAYESPDTWLFPYVMGTNALYRRSALVEIGGFDENYAFYLDETDVCLRLLERGWRVRCDGDGYVHHRFLPSNIRNTERVTTDLRNVLSSRAYFAARHGLPVADQARLAASLTTFIEAQRGYLAGHEQMGRAPGGSIDRFDADVGPAIDRGIAAAAQPPQTRARAELGAGGAIKRYPTTVAGDPLTVVVVSQDYPPGPTPGIGRASHTLATGLAHSGHEVHVVTSAPVTSHAVVEREDGVWVHRVPTVAAQGEAPVPGLPAHIWDRACTVLAEVELIAERHGLDVVHLPNWDSEGIAVLASRRWPTMLYAYTPVLALADTDPRFDAESELIGALAQAERWCYAAADVVAVSFSSTFDYLCSAYDIEIENARQAILPLGIPDLPDPSIVSGAPGDDRLQRHREGGLEILFVGRLEARKGADVLAAAVPLVCDACPDVTFHVIGRDACDAEGLTLAERTLRQRPDLRARVRFVGEVSDEEVAAAYRSADIFVAPSRFESFGLINLEAMRVGCPVVSAAVNGISSVVRDGIDGVLVPPGDARRLADALVELASSPERRVEMGRHGRARFVESFTSTAMLERFVASFRALRDTRPQPTAPPDQLQATGRDTTIAARRQAALLAALRCPSCGEAPVLVDAVTCVDGRTKTATITCRSDGRIGSIHAFQVDLVDDPKGAAPLAGTRRVPALGEYRLGPMAAQWSLDDGWERHDGALRAVRPGSVARIRAVCTDVRLRLLGHPGGGLLNVRVDDRSPVQVDTAVDEGSVNVVFEAAADLPLCSHLVEVELAVGTPEGSDGLVLEAVLLGYGSRAFAAPMPFARGNEYSPQIERFLADAPSDALILEVGGGDRRTGNAKHLVMEYLPYEGPDIRGDIHKLPFAENTFDRILSQAVFEHLANPFTAADELVRICKPGGLILTEVAFMQPLHAVPYHFFNMTQWGVDQLFSSTCEQVESDWFGPLSFTLNWLIDAAGIPSQLSADRLEALRAEFAALDDLVDHAALKPVASGVYSVVRKGAAATP